MGRIGEPVGLYCAQWMIYREAAPFHDPLKRLKLKTLASDSVFLKDNFKTLPLLIYYVKLYMLHHSLSALFL